MLYNPPEAMCRWNWKDCKDVAPEECHYRAKRTQPKEED